MANVVAFAAQQASEHYTKASVNADAACSAHLDDDMRRCIACPAMGPGNAKASRESSPIQRIHWNLAACD